MIFTIDEYGNGTGEQNGVIWTLVSGMQFDPGPGDHSPALFYDLGGPTSFVAGDLVLQEVVGGPASDIIRFNPSGAGGFDYPAGIYFYSDIGDGADAPADRPFPAALYTNVVYMLEVGPEGNNGVVYIPTAGQPGYFAIDTMQYNITSDSIPEPGTLGLLAAGLGLISFRIFRRR
jgi:hypothetical protein